jgi:hypothetical protein
LSVFLIRGFAFRYVIYSHRVIIALGAPTSIITGFDIDTAHFTGNYGPEASVWGLKLEGKEEEVRKEEGLLDGDDSRVRHILLPGSFLSFRSRSVCGVFEGQELMTLPSS